MRRRGLALVLAAGLTAATAAAASASAGLAGPIRTTPHNSRAATAATAKIGHVWTIVLENSEFEQTFIADRSSAPYLTQTLPSLGKLVVQYYGTGHSSADNYVAMASGQGPNLSTKGDCDDPTTLGGGSPDPAPDASAKTWHFDADGQAVDDSGAATIGCTYPAGVKNIGDQLTAANVSWKAYMENMDAQPGKPNYCSNPFAPPSTDVKRVDLQNPATPDYKDKHNPWAFFHSTFDNNTPAADGTPGYCDQHVVPFGYFQQDGTGLAGQFVDDLQSVDTTPQYSFITPDQCHDGHDTSTNGCTNIPTGQPGLVGADQFLQQVIPAIMNSPAYKQDGLIVVLFDEGTSNLACCGEKRAPNLPANASNGYGPADVGLPVPDPVTDGGGMTGALLLSPFVTPNTVDETNQFNHYSYLRSMEDLFGITTGGTDGLGHLGYAGEPGLMTFQDAGEFNASPASGGTSAGRLSAR